MGTSLWRMEGKGRYFLIPEDCTPVPGEAEIVSFDGKSATVADDWLSPFEITEDQAHQWGKDQLGQTLDELKQGIDEKLADWRQQLDELNRRSVSESSAVNRNAGSALVDLLKLFPSVLGNSLSGEETRLDSAKQTMATLQQQLKEAGIDLDDRFTNFPDRLAELRKDYERQRAEQSSKSGESGSPKL